MSSWTRWSSRSQPKYYPSSNNCRKFGWVIVKLDDMLLVIGMNVKETGQNAIVLAVFSLNGKMCEMLLDVWNKINVHAWNVCTLMLNKTNYTLHFLNIMHSGRG